jgi:hypothetical protein
VYCLTNHLHPFVLAPFRFSSSLSTLLVLFSTCKSFLYHNAISSKWEVSVGHARKDSVSLDRRCYRSTPLNSPSSVMRVQNGGLNEISVKKCSCIIYNVHSSKENLLISWSTVEDYCIAFFISVTLNLKSDLCVKCLQLIFQVSPTLILRFATVKIWMRLQFDSTFICTSLKSQQALITLCACKTRFYRIGTFI